MQMQAACFSVDVEPDCISYLKSFRGMEEGIYPLLAMLKEERVRGTFFTTGQVAEMYPEAVAAIIKDGHELGCHGFSRPHPYRQSRSRVRPRCVSSLGATRATRT